MSNPLLPYYEGGAEKGRLEGAGALELRRTQDILTRRLPPSPAVVLDVGGGPGVYALWLSERGYTVHLVNMAASHIDQARAAAAARGVTLASATVGDARRLDLPDGSADAVLLLGPLYHLTERSDREEALREAARALRPGGVVVAAVISRFASLLDGLRAGYLDQPAFAAIVRQDLADGQHRNPTRDPRWFTTAYFHRPEEPATEMRMAGLQYLGTLAVEGPAWLLPDVEARLADPARAAQLMDALRSVEEEPSLAGASAHLLALGRKIV